MQFETRVKAHRRTWTKRVWTIAVCALLGLMCDSQIVRAQELVLSDLPLGQVCEPGGKRSEDAVWEVSTRRLPKCWVQCDVPWDVHRWEVGCWHPSTASSIIEASHEPETQTIIYVHGNWMPVCDARNRAICVYKALACRSDRPLRFILFSWPSEKDDRPARDVISKKPLISASSNYLAKFVQDLSPEQPVGLLGYSFGGAIVCGSLHLLAGGALDGQAMCNTPSEVPLMRVSLIAPAFDRTALGVNGRYSMAFEQVDKMINLYNSRDPILRRFRYFDRNTDPIAAGFAGLMVTRAVSPLNANEKIVQYDCSAVGRSHAELEYLQCSHYFTAIDNVLSR